MPTCQPYRFCSVAAAANEIEAWPEGKLCRLLPSGRRSGKMCLSAVAPSSAAAMLPPAWRSPCQSPCAAGRPSAASISASRTTPPASFQPFVSLAAAGVAINIAAPAIAIDRSIGPLRDRVSLRSGGRSTGDGQPDLPVGLAFERAVSDHRLEQQRPAIEVGEQRIAARLFPAHIVLYGEIDRGDPQV